MPSTRESLGKQAEGVCRALRGRQAGTIHVMDANCRVEETPEGEPRVFIDLVLSDPLDGEDTWPVEDLLSLQTDVDQTAVRAELGVPWQVAMRRQSPEQYDEDPSPGA